MNAWEMRENDTVLFGQKKTSQASLSSEMQSQLGHLYKIWPRLSIRSDLFTNIFGHEKDLLGSPYMVPKKIVYCNKT